MLWYGSARMILMPFFFVLVILHPIWIVIVLILVVIVVIIIFVLFMNCIIDVWIGNQMRRRRWRIHLRTGCGEKSRRG